MDRLIVWSQEPLCSMIQALNEKIAGIASATGSLLVDVDGLAGLVGRGAWYMPSEWNSAKLPFGSDFLPLYADHVARVIAARRGRSRKCLVLDLDNTLWGGVIGDDGLEGIKLSQGDAEGEAFLDLQRYALQLRNRGIVLAVCSKNTDEVARSPFRQHPEMILKEEHIAVFQANWADKATNIQTIAESLSFSLDAMVFVDDNPMERDLVRRTLPEVAVIELPGDPAFYARTLASCGWFESTAFSTEDKARADAYAGNARRLDLRGEATDIECYLRSLEMVLTFAPFDPIGRARIVQLVAKSNQYNLTTRRYTPAEIERMESDPEVLTLQIRLADRFGDNGMISVVICNAPLGADEWRIDTWLMSCRVLERRVENAVLAEIARHARRAGANSLIGTYAPSRKNALVADHYGRLGFKKERETSDGCTEWRILVRDVHNESLFEIRRLPEVDLESREMMDDQEAARLLLI